MTVRPCLASDADAIADMFAEFVSYLRSIGDRTAYRFGKAKYLTDGFGGDPAFRGFIAEDEGQSLGYVLFSPWYDGEYIRGFYLVDLYVREAARRRGVGLLLLNAVKGLARDEGIARISWEVHTGNAAALRFYEAIGARTSETSVMHLDV